MSTYVVQAGDTFANVSRRTYGSERGVANIQAANPGVLVLTPGIILTIPPLPNSPKQKPQKVPFVDPDEVAITIENNRFRFWTEVKINRAIDTFDTVEFLAPFESKAKDYRQTFRPFSYKDVNVTVGQDRLFTGTMVGVRPNITPTEKTLTVSCYSRPGVLNDCTMPASSYPINFLKQNIQQISEYMARPFGIDVIFDADPGAEFFNVMAEPKKKVLSFLTKLAKQRNLIMSSNEEGALVFLNKKTSVTDNPVAILKQSEAPLMTVEPEFTEQAYYSDITGIEPVVAGLAGSKFTVKNPRLNGVIRPISFDVDDTLDADIKTVVETKAAKMFGSAVSYTVEVNTWRDKDGELWEPGATILLLAPDAMVYSEYKFIIRNVQFSRTGNDTTAKLNLVVPGAYSATLPKTLPWDES